MAVLRRDRSGYAEERPMSGRGFTDVLAMDLERSIAEREAIGADPTVLRRELDAGKVTLATTEATIDARDRKLGMVGSLEPGGPLCKVA